MDSFSDVGYGGFHKKIKLWGCSESCPFYGGRVHRRSKVYLRGESNFQKLNVYSPFWPLKYSEKQNENESNFFIFSETFVKCFINSPLLYLSPMLLLWKKFNFYLAWILQKKKTKKQTNYNKSMFYYELQTIILSLVSKLGFRCIGVFSMGLISNHIKEGVNQ